MPKIDSGDNRADFGTRSRPSSWRSLAFSFLVILIGGGFVLQKAADVGRSRDVDEPAILDPEFTEASDNSQNEANSTLIPMQISDGVQDTRVSSDAEIPLEVTTPSGRDSFFIKIIDGDGAAIMSIFLSPGANFTTKLDPGEYRVRWATGRIWQGEKFFGPSTVFYAQNEVLEFSKNGDDLIGRKVTFSNSGAEPSENHLIGQSEF